MNIVSHSRKPAWLGRILFLSAAAAVVAAGATRGPRWLAENSAPAFIGRVAVVCALVTLCLWAAFRRRRFPLRRIVAEAFIAALALFVVEAAASRWAPASTSAQLTRARTASKLGLPFDQRAVSDVVGDLRAQNVDALPGMWGGWARLPQVRSQLPAGFYPLANASHATIVECNEGGRYLTYRSGDYGFNNRPGLLDASNLDIAVVGESFALGHCLPAPYSLVGILRRAYPRTANVGMAGTCTLGQLGLFREYVEPLKPRLVLWTVNPDFVSVPEDLADPVLRGYLDPAFSQHLRQRQDEVDRYVRKLALPVQRERDEAAREKIREQSRHPLWTLSNLRERALPLLRKQLALHHGAGATPPDLKPFMQAVTLAHATVADWGGRFAVVLLPTYAEVVADEVSPLLRHGRLAWALREAGIPVIDGTALFESQQDPASLYTMRINNHPTREGYALLGARVLEGVRLELPQRLAAAE